MGEWRYQKRKIIVLAMVLSFLIGLLMASHLGKPDGRLIVDEVNDEYFVALTAKPEELKRKKQIKLRVFSK